jgi:hypothetical protein
VPAGHGVTVSPVSSVGTGMSCGGSRRTSSTQFDFGCGSAPPRIASEMPFLLLSSAGTGGLRGVHGGSVASLGCGVMLPNDASTKSSPPVVPGEKPESALPRSMRPSMPRSAGTH